MARPRTIVPKFGQRVCTYAERERGVVVRRCARYHDHPDDHRLYDVE